jgi:hypothetical protein
MAKLGDARGGGGGRGAANPRDVARVMNEVNQLVDFCENQVECR